MTTEPKFDTYLFTRAEGFYPVHITKDSVAANIQCNPGTLMVEEYSRNGQHKTIWTQADGWLDSKYAALFGGQP